MSQYSLSDVFVVTYRHTDGYSFDTGLPEEVFTTRDEAETVAKVGNESATKLTFYDGKDRLFVETLADRLERIRDECRSEGESMNQHGE